ncbi:SRPBCC family protein [Umezawaea endophytica]|uniref:SRPBCC family protein n=1 Tax=Umezawaea endophytica TaxID=1654476 RepID=A0A9X2VJB5_9PSEU|nr:SRPBCC family protein [Umezawaea endophytica]MCS7477174.1 SRPBCC family protein [Umezawaea endophytica]
MDEVRKVDTGTRTVTRQVVVNAPAETLFAMLADPRRHGEVDGSGTVLSGVRGPVRLSDGAEFSTAMKMYGFPYRITSRVTAFEDGRLIEWRHPMGHHWRWTFDEHDGRTTVTETFDYNGSRSPKVLELLKMPALNAKGIRSTLAGLRDRFA